MVYPAYQAMISHHRLKAFDKLKKDLELPSSIEEGFAIKASRCAEACLSEFDHGCEGIKSILLAIFEERPDTTPMI